MGRRRWQHYQQLLMENVHLKDVNIQMEKKDWESSDKCNFCDESSSTSQHTFDNIVPTSKEQSQTKNHSSESSYETEDSGEEALLQQAKLNFQESRQYNTSDIPETSDRTTTKSNSMSSLDSVSSSVAASMAAVAAMNTISLPKPHSNLRFSNFVSADMIPQWYLPPSSFKFSPNTKREHMDVGVADDQPLDLSAKSCSPLNSPRESPTELPSPILPTQGISSITSASSSPLQSLKVPVYNSNRHIFKAKPRLSPMAGRRTYTEEELQAALRDIQSRKLGTRRAAVLYGIPRSTLRNKVYKLAMEKERDHTAILQSLSMEERRREGETDVLSDEKEDLEYRENENDEDNEDTDKELSQMEDEKKDKCFMKPTFTVEDLIKYSKRAVASPTAENNPLKTIFQQNTKHDNDLLAGAQLPPPLYSIFPPGAAEIWGNLDAASITPYLTHLMAVSRENFNISSLLTQASPYLNLRNVSSSTSESPNENSGLFATKFPTPLFPELMQKMLAESEEPRSSGEVHKSKKVETISFASSPAAEVSQEELTNNLTSNILHRLPFFKSHKNGSTATTESRICNISEYNTDNRVSEGSEKTLSPPPLNNPRSASSSPIPLNNKAINLRDVITNAISNRYHQQQHDEIPIAHNAAISSNVESVHRVSSLAATNSVIQSHSGLQTDERKLCNQSKVPLSSSTAAAAAAAAASSSSGTGKGTRPKRGKYRNYDRDSLVEAVRAVQRGEMSVHRAGSYYGVPHSTLEYKVKERHLMRPRKREPKNPPDELKRREDNTAIRLSSINEKPAQHSPSPQPKVSKSPFTPATSLSTAPNGLKIPTLFEPGHPFSPTAPFPFWPAPFHQLAMDYSRSSSFVTSPEHLLASHFVQRMQEESAKSNQTTATLAALGKNAREVAESLYDGSGISGSFLDGVIRSSLDNEQVFSDNSQKRNLLEQLYKNKYLNPHTSRQGESDEEGIKPNLNRILAQTLLSTVSTMSKDVSPKDEVEETSEHELMENITAGPSEEASPNKSDDLADTHNQSLNIQVESQGVNMEIKSKKN